MDRVLIAGISGAGKTTLACALSRRFGLPHHEVDALHHGPGWAKRPTFEADVRTFSSGRRWVTEDAYHAALGDLLWIRADTLVWLDLPRRTVMWRVIRRSARRAAHKEELWNGNKETWSDWVRPDHPIRWAWSQFECRRQVVGERIGHHPHLRVIHLHTGHQARHWLATIDGTLE